MSDTEAVLLTGGASRRMGSDKASLTIDGEPIASRIARELATVCNPVTVLGREPIEGFAFQMDREDYQGPLVALSGFGPSKDYVFVASCDLPLFDASVVSHLRTHIAAYEAIVPVLDGRLQPLCALYRRVAFDSLDPEERRMIAWVRSLRSVEVDATTFPNPDALTNVNTPEEWKALGL